MIVLDTNVVSEMMRPQTRSPGLAWLDAQPLESMWTTSVTLYEVRVGLGLLPEGRRRRNLEADFNRVLREGLSNRVLVFDSDAARIAADFDVKLRRLGRTVSLADLQIAGIVAAHGATLATRNVRHFADTGLSLVDPWDAEAPAP